MGWRKRPPGEGGGYLEDLALGCNWWPTLALAVLTVLVLSRRTRHEGRSYARRGWRVDTHFFPTQGGDLGGDLGLGWAEVET
jgi:hypothetical protein